MKATWVQRDGRHAGALEPLRKLHGVQHVGELGLRVRRPAVVLALLEVDVLEVDDAGLAHGFVVEAAGDAHDPGGFGFFEDIEQEIRQDEVADVIGSELHFEVVFGLGEGGQIHHACIVYQAVQRIIFFFEL